MTGVLIAITTNVFKTRHDSLANNMRTDAALPNHNDFMYWLHPARQLHITTGLFAYIPHGCLPTVPPSPMRAA